MTQRLDAARVVPSIASGQRLLNRSRRLVVRDLIYSLLNFAISPPTVPLPEELGTVPVNMRVFVPI
jgi:hypothetical protein